MFGVEEKIRKHIGNNLITAISEAESTIFLCKTWILVARAALEGPSSACALNTIASVHRATANEAMTTATLVARAAIELACSAGSNGVTWLGKHTLTT